MPAYNFRNNRMLKELMYTHVYTHIYICMHKTQTDKHTHMYACTHMYVHTHAHLHTYTHTHMCVYTHTIILLYNYIKILARYNWPLTVKI